MNPSEKQDREARIGRLDEQAMALVPSLLELLKGRPIDVVVDALATAACRLIRAEADFNFGDDECQEGVRNACFVVQELQRFIGPARRDRLFYVFYELQCAALASALINAEEG